MSDLEKEVNKEILKEKSTPEYQILLHGEQHPDMGLEDKKYCETNNYTDEVDI